jgi:hypothetical protein
MREFAEKLRVVEREMSSERGDFLLFALFLREDASDSWDLLVSAQWLEADKSEGLKYLASKVQSSGTAAELVKLSQIVIIGRDQPMLAAIQSAVCVEHGFSEISRNNFNGLRIDHAYIITSRRELTPV